MLHACSRQLDRQRQPVELAADRGDGRRIGLEQDEPGVDGARPLDEQAHRLVRGERIRAGHRPREGKRLDRKLLFPAQVQRGAARGQNLQRRTAEKQRCGQIGGRGQEMLAIVHQHQGLPRSQLLDELLLDRQSGNGDDAERRGHGQWHEHGIGQRRQIDPDRTVGELVRDVAGDGERQAGFAEAAGTGQRQQGNGLVEEQGASRRPLGLPANQARARQGEGGAVAHRVAIGDHAPRSGERCGIINRRDGQSPRLPVISATRHPSPEHSITPRSPRMPPRLSPGNSTGRRRRRRRRPACGGRPRARRSLP